ncbi:DUF421 domain-containing protein [Desertibacillus haloalkaliphilus]|nr:DUF421 domain-containing protein [Desertibacillus haloalkaliphilus]
MTMIMGRRSIGELPVFDFLVVLILGSVVGADLADPSIDHIHTAVAIILIALFQVFVTKTKITNRTFGRLITFEPVIVIYQGKFLIENLTKIRYSIDNILQMLRENDVFDVSDVKIAIIEGNGKLTIHKKGEKSAVTVEDLGLTKKKTGLSFPVIIDGEIYYDVLEKLKLDEQWLKDQLQQAGISKAQSVFFASVNEQHQLHVSINEDQHLLLRNVPPMHH